MHKVRLTSYKTILVFLLVLPILFSLYILSRWQHKFELISEHRDDSVESSAVEKLVPAVPKIAVLMVGDIRDLIYDQRIMMLYHEHMVKVYGHQNLYIFLHISMQLRDGKTVGIHEMQAAMDYLQPAEIVVTRNKLPSRIPVGNVPGVEVIGPTGEQLLRIRSCYRMSLKYARDHNIKFDWFIKTRPDLFLWIPLPSLDTFRKDAISVVGGWPKGTEDLFWVVSAANGTANIAMDSIPALDLSVSQLVALAPSSKTIGKLSPEAIIQAWRVHNNVKTVEQSDIMLGIARFVEEYGECSAAYHGAAFPRSQPYIDRCKDSMKDIHLKIASKEFQSEVKMRHFNISSVLTWKESESYEG